MAYYYVGQAFDISHRVLTQHSNPTYRKQSPSLHYFIWENLLKDPAGMSEKFVLLSVYDQKPDAERISLQEMWASLTLQTLPSATLNAYLPNAPQCFMPWAGKQLNISAPVLQAFSTNALSQD